MFTQAELLEEMPKLIEQSRPLMEQVGYSPLDFEWPDAEQTIDIHRGTRTDFTDALQFWVHSLHRQNWNAPDYFLNYARNGKFAKMTLAEFNAFIAEYSNLLKAPLTLTPKGKFVSAMQMYDDWNDVAVLAEFSEEYISFYWATTA